MSKGILIIDMPSRCGECALRMAMICTPTMKDIDSVNTKMDWCPLSKVPQRISPDGQECFSELKYMDGWNDCINQILRGEK